jgi:hypothetical protein
MIEILGLETAFAWTGILHLESTEHLSLIPYRTSEMVYMAWALGKTWADLTAHGEMA